MKDNINSFNYSNNNNTIVTEKRQFDEIRNQIESFRSQSGASSMERSSLNAAEYN